MDAASLLEKINALQAKVTETTNEMSHDVGELLTIAKELVKKSDHSMADPLVIGLTVFLLACFVEHLAHIAEETGDLLFAVVNLARHAKADPEMALIATNAKFERRFAYIERTLAGRGSSLEQATLHEMDALWNEAKTEG